MTHVLLGDSVTFQHLDGLLCAANDQTLCEVAHSPSSRAATLFRVTPMQDYAMTMNNNKSTIESKNINKQQQQNQQNQQQPQQQQQQQQFFSSHRAFVYGQIVQLIHVQSGKFLHGGATTTASASTGGAYALLDVNGDARCYWKLGIPLSSRGLRRVGDRVQSGDEVHLEHAVSGMFMHASPFVTTDDGELRALLATAPDSTFVIRRAGRTTQQRRVAPHDAMRLVRRDGRFLVACTKSRSVWFLRVLDDNESPETASSIWILENNNNNNSFMYRLFGTRFYLAHSEDNLDSTPLILSEKPGDVSTLFVADSIAFETPFHLRHAASQHLVRSADVESSLNDVQLYDECAASELLRPALSQPQLLVRAVASSRRASPEHACMARSVCERDLRRHALVHRQMAPLDRYIRQLRRVNGNVGAINEDVTDAAAAAVELLAAHCVQHAAFESVDSSDFATDERAAALLFGDESNNEKAAAGRFVIRSSASNAELRAALDVCASHQDAIGTPELVERLARCSRCRSPTTWSTLASAF
jgi:hypothetical protein